MKKIERVGEKQRDGFAAALAQDRFNALLSPLIEACGTTMDLVQAVHVKPGEVTLVVAVVDDEGAWLFVGGELITTVVTVPVTAGGGE